MMRKGEIAFSTIVSVIIAAAVMILILLWVIPNFSDIFGTTEEVADAVIDEDAVLELTCKNLCAEAKRVDNGTLTSDIEFCGKAPQCKTVGVLCEGVCL
jgi:hypothetical protein